MIFAFHLGNGTLNGNNFLFLRRKEMSEGINREGMLLYVVSHKVFSVSMQGMKTD